MIGGYREPAAITGLAKITFFISGSVVNKSLYVWVLNNEQIFERSS